MKKNIKTIIAVIISGIIGYCIGNNSNDDNITVEDKFTTRVIEVPAMTVTRTITEVEVVRDTLKIASAVKTGMIQNNLEYYRLNYVSDFKPTETFQGAEIQTTLAVELVNFKPQVLNEHSFITINPYPYKKHIVEVKIYKDYPFWKKAGIFVLGGAVGYSVSRF